MREMKDSGVEWIGEIPIEWKICKLKNIASIQTGNTPPKNKQSTFYSDESGTPWIKAEDLGKSDSISETKEYLTEAGKKEGRIFPANTVFVCCIASVGKTGFSEQECSCNQQINGIIFNRMQWKYGFYMTLAQKSEYIFNASGNVMKIINTEKQANLWCPLPAKCDQESIVNYLDSKCSKIDGIVVKQQAIIEKLKEYKLSIITEAVTKGFSDKKETKKSRVEWVDEIPVGWSNIKLKHCTYIRARLGWKGLKADEYVEAGYPLLSAFNIVNSKLDFENNINYINRERYEESPEIMLKLGDVLLVKDGAGIGKCAIIEEMPLPSTTNGSLAVITTDNKLLPKYLYYYFQSSMFQKYIDRVKDGMGVPHLFQSDLREIEVVIPTIDEQETIITILDKKMQILDETVKKKETIIEKLQEYKKSLIYEVVTGKKEV